MCLISSVALSHQHNLNWNKNDSECSWNLFSFSACPLRVIQPCALSLLLFCFFYFFFYFFSSFSSFSFFSFFSFFFFFFFFFFLYFCCFCLRFLSFSLLSRHLSAFPKKSPRRLAAMQCRPAPASGARRSRNTVQTAIRRPTERPVIGQTEPIRARPFVALLK
ncbi:uncharacterized protein ASCRUDRAFT_127937 [Ascoidea rubescens DSM 1968]|uniref:Uncharacterized protein n=1 Tax=Ascoidea rubescens DSM 1968 TaxID=1344418 RepID=A0A1D2VNP1_9ASCO|nr:hypothetical protein ASCRUDRAFT_127937 [Ascoidea rubescens DSM 1968]ODV63209.1 hypothetical protein ASCRUDRAFT_127937 [Ascoidea rubescens DSM 1968]